MPRMEPQDEGIDDELLARAAAVAATRGETVDDVIERALRAYLDGADCSDAAEV